MKDPFWDGGPELTPEQEKLAGDHLVGIVLAIILVFLIAAGTVAGKAFGWW